MIQAKDLRTSNLIYRLDNVSEVDWSTIKLCAQRNKQFNEDWKPIPLTPEWLERFGFIQGMYAAAWSISIGKEYQYIYVNVASGESGIVMFDEDDDYTDNEPFIMNFKYVHELQNLYFCLTGKELTLKEQTF